MHLALSSMLGLWLLASAPCADDTQKPSQSSAPLRQRYRTLVREHQDAVSRFWQNYQAIRNPEARRRYYQAKYPAAKLYIQKFLEIVNSDPRDDAAVNSLIWIVRNGGYDPGVDRAVVRLTQEFAASPRLGEMAPNLVPNLVYSLSPSAEDLFRAIIEKNPDRAAKGRACVALAQYLKQEAALVRSMKGDTVEARQLQAHYQSEADKGLIERLRDKDPDSLARDADSAAERAQKEFADVADFLRILDPIAQAGLFAAGSPGIGNAAPRSRGKTCPVNPCGSSSFAARSLCSCSGAIGPALSRIPAPARSLVARMEGKPFALVGVNSDPDRTAVRAGSRRRRSPGRPGSTAAARGRLPLNSRSPAGLRSMS